MGIKTLKQAFSRSAGLRILVLLLAVAGASLPAFTQQITGSIVGTVKDPQGAVVSGARVKATNMDTGFTRSAPDQWISANSASTIFPWATTPSR